MKLSLITLYVTDIEKSLDFYNRVLKMPIIRRKIIFEDKEMVFLGNNTQTQLELIEIEKEYNYSGFSIGYEVDNLAEVRDEIVAEGFSVIREFKPSENITLCFIAGPNGETIELIENK